MIRVEPPMALEKLLILPLFAMAALWPCNTSCQMTTR
jgi:hypothetical protein